MARRGGPPHPQPSREAPTLQPGPIPTPRRPARLLAALALGLALACPARAQDAAALRASGVTAARAGDLAEGRRLLEAALAAAPGDVATLADLTVVLSWAGRDREALARFAQLDASTAPP
ncbi:MAG TPA: tetratricopeptide repeat protein, partial [Roseomonas sp.]|nr:tetratricopeptide repeat protein [Roseomonas sp.]